MLSSTAVRYKERDQVFECVACGQTMSVSRATLRDPESFVTQLELHQLDHSECPKYQDATLARNARMFRKEAQRLLLVTAGCKSAPA